MIVCPDPDIQRVVNRLGVVQESSVYVLVLTPEEFHDMRVIAHIPEDALRTALKASPVWISPDTHSQTHDVYHLLDEVRKFR